MNWLWFRYAKVLSTELSDLYNDRQKRSRRWSIIYDSGRILQKNWRGLKLSRQQHVKTRLKQLFQATVILCKSVSVSDQTSQAYVRVGRQYAAKGRELTQLHNSVARGNGLILHVCAHLFTSECFSQIQGYDATLQTLHNNDNAFCLRLPP